MSKEKHETYRAMLDTDTFKIAGKYKNGEYELLNIAKGYIQARDLCNEYRMAWGKDWAITCYNIEE